MVTREGRREGGREGGREEGRYLLQMARDGDLHRPIDAKGVQPGLALSKVLQPGALLKKEEREGGREGRR